jgi:hypothetical protein
MQPAELHSDSGLEVVGAFSHRDLVPFLLEELSRRTKVLRVYWALGYVYALALVGCLAYASVNGEFSFFRLLAYTLAYSLLALPLLVVVHEGIHALAYWVLGARKLQLGWKWQQAYVYIAAPGFVLDKRGFGLVALAPLLLIAAVLIALLVVLDGPLWWAVLGLLGWHWLSCVGDVGLFSFALQHTSFYTYDDSSESKTYFFSKREAPVKEEVNANPR